MKIIHNFYCIIIYNHVAEVTIKVKLNKEERKRQQHIHELITTEQAYIEDMTAVHEVWLFLICIY
jgi:hypothetical protein